MIAINIVGSMSWNSNLMYAKLIVSSSVWSPCNFQNKLKILDPKIMENLDLRPLLISNHMALFSKYLVLTHPNKVVSEWKYRHWLNDNIILPHISIEAQLADLFTKSILLLRFSTFRNKLQFLSLHAPRIWVVLVTNLELS